MWETIKEEFSRVPSQAEVARYMLEIGVRVDGQRIFLDKVSISHSQLASALEKDKRIVKSTLKTISSNERLYRIFSKLKPSCNLVDVASVMGWDVIEITLSDPALPGVLGKIASTIGESGVSIRQAIGEDPTYSTGLLFIITETEIPGSVFEGLRQIEGVDKITLYR
jgi:predicted regulator of amino acid metabolism with ACT domain